MHWAACNVVTSTRFTQGEPGVTAQSDDIVDRRPDGNFDTTAELWDRIVDDITRRGAPCLETVEALVDEACQRPPGTEPSKSQQD